MLGFRRTEDLESLDSVEEISLFIARERALALRVEREAAEQQVRHLRIDLAERLVFLAAVVLVLIALTCAAISDPPWPKTSGFAAGALAVLGAVGRLRSQPAVPRAAVRAGSGLDPP
jgi:hypothetical protein